MGTDYKVCPSCNEKNNPSFSQCWKCNSEFEKQTIIDINNKINKKPITASKIQRFAVRTLAILFIFSGLAMILINDQISINKESTPSFIYTLIGFLLGLVGMVLAIISAQEEIDNG